MGLIVNERNGNILIACFFYLIVFYAMMRWGRRDLILSDLGRNPETFCVNQMYQKTMMIMETEKD
jgi:hypothetical protein